MTPSQKIIVAYEAGSITWPQIAEAFGEDAADWAGFDEFREYLDDSEATACRVNELGIGGDIGDAVTASYAAMRARAAYSL
jgi:hypothetical protein